MFFNRKLFPILDAPSAFVYQLSDKELQKYTVGINRFSAAFNINILKKEDTFMVEKLEAYKAELEAKKVELNDTVIDVEADVAAFREKLIADETAKIAVCIAKIDSDIDCIEHLIECEKAKEAATVEAEAVITENIIE